MATINFQNLCHYDSNEEKWQSFILKDSQHLQNPWKTLSMSLVSLMINHENPKKKIQLLRGFSVLFTVFLLGKQEKVYHNTWQNYEDSVNIASIAIL